MSYRYVVLLISLLGCVSALAQPLSWLTLSGTIREAGSLESIPGATVSAPDLRRGTTANAYGFYSLQVPVNQSVRVVVSVVGYESVVQTFRTDQNTVWNVMLAPVARQLAGVTITAAEQNLHAPVAGLVQLPISQIRQIPTPLGEKDVIKALQLLPGVQKGTEGSTALYVRGGGPDQNLLLLDEATVYNANHLFGFFSTFNGDAIKSVNFYKGSFPARYGGRLSSVVDMQMKDGNREKFHGEGGIGLLSSRLTLEGPIQKSKSSFLISARRSYIDLLTVPFTKREDSYFAYRFYDLNAKLNVDLGPKDKLFVSGYFGNDRLRLVDKIGRSTSSIEATTALGWGNATGTLRWNHVFNPKLFANTTLLLTDFNFRFADDLRRDYADGRPSITEYAEFASAIRDYSLKADFDYFPSNAHAVKFGGLLTHHRFQPRAYVLEDATNNQRETASQRFDNLEFALYAEDTFQPAGRFSANAGLRLSGLRTATKTYLFAEPRLTVGYRLRPALSLKAAYARNNQFVHLLSNTGTGLATDLWVPATDRVPPPQSDQISAGLVKTFAKSGLTLTVESYRKWMRNIVAYREGATFLSLGDGARELAWEDNVTTGRGLSYGTEVLLQKTKGRFTGWLGYTLSWTVHQFDDLNGGNRFFPRYDRRHDLSLVGTYRLSPKVELSANWVYGTGNALTVPQGYYYGLSSIGGQESGESNGSQPSYPLRQPIDYFGPRNSFRAEAYHRLDVAVRFFKQKRWGERFWEIGLYNAYNRQNPFYYYLKTNYGGAAGRSTSLEKKSLLPIIPSVTYNFKF